MTIYFQGIGEQAHIFGDLGSPAKKLKNLTLKEKPSFCLTFFKRFLQLLGVAPPDPPLDISMYLLSCKYANLD